MDGAEEKLDFSIRPYEEWVRFLFEQDPVLVEKRSAFDPYDFATFPEHPQVLVEYMTRLCRDLRGLVEKYDWTRIDSGLWGALAFPFEIAHNRLLADDKIPLDLRIECIYSMKLVFTDVVAKIPPDVCMENIFFMWWHMVCSSLVVRELPFDPKDLSPEKWRAIGEWLGGFPDLDQPIDQQDISKLRKTAQEMFPGMKEDDVIRSVRDDPSIATSLLANRRLLDAAYRTLKEILELSDPRCQSCALHGLGHLAHPEAAALVQSYIDRKKDTITADQMKWLEACRDGTVM